MEHPTAPPETPPGRSAAPIHSDSRREALPNVQAGEGLDASFHFLFCRSSLRHKEMTAAVSHVDWLSITPNHLHHLLKQMAIRRQPIAAGVRGRTMPIGERSPGFLKDRL